MRTMTDFESLLRAGEKCCNGSRWKSSVQTFEMTILRQTSNNKKKLENNKYVPCKTADFMLCERGKWRRIQSHRVSDRQVFKVFCENVLKPAMRNKILNSNAASQVGKGTEYSIKLFRQGLAKAYRKWGKNFYVVTFDYHNYFGSIPHDKIGVSLGLEGNRMLEQYIEMFSNGIGIGGEPSQDIAVGYPSRLDRTMACQVLAYGRYMDDGYAICHTLEDARQALKDIRRISSELGLVINDNRTGISNMRTDSVVWLKKRTHLTDTGKIIMQITRENVRNELRNLKRQKRLVDNGEMPVDVVYQSILCWCSYANKYNSKKQVYRVAQEFSRIFNVPWDIAKKLTRRRLKGWINELRSKTS